MYTNCDEYWISWIIILKVMRFEYEVIQNSAEIIIELVN